MVQVQHILAKTATIDPNPILDHAILEQFKTFRKAAIPVGTPENNEPELQDAFVYL